jgi:hypothetical protein
MTGQVDLAPAGGNKPVEKEQLVRDLHDLQRGRGLRRPDLSQALGPALLHHFSLVTGGSDGEEGWRTVAGALRRVSKILPRDERLVFLAALGIDDDGRLLQDRLRISAEKLNLSIRSVQRRLNDANRRVAVFLSSSNGEYSDLGTWAQRPEAWETLWELYDLDLSRRTPELVISQEINALADLSEITKTISVPQTGGVLGIASGSSSTAIKAFTRLTPSSLEFTVTLPPVRAGQRHTVAVRINAPAPAQLRPYLVMVPAEPAPALFVARVRFHPSRIPSELRVVRDLPPLALLDEAIGGPAQLDAQSRAEVRFRRPNIGQAYGIRWSHLR